MGLGPRPTLAGGLQDRRDIRRGLPGLCPVKILPKGKEMEFTALCSENSLGRLGTVWETAQHSWDLSVHCALRQGLGVTV